MLGDTNIDVSVTNRQTRKLHDFYKNLLLSQVITVPTRVTETTMTIIDHVCTNNLDLYARSGCVDPDLSDHMMVFTSRKQAHRSKGKKTMFIRNYRKLDPMHFCMDINNIDWSNVYEARDVNEAVNCFNSDFLNVINNHMPFKKCRVRIQQSPWVSYEMLSLIDCREYLQKQNQTM